MRFFEGNTPVYEILDASNTWMPNEGEYVRFSPSEEAWLVEATVIVYDGDRVSSGTDRLDIALSRPVPGIPFPQITRAPREMTLIPPLPEESQSAKAISVEKGRKHRGVDRKSNPDARKEGKGAGNISPSPGDHTDGG